MITGFFYENKLKLIDKARDIYKKGKHWFSLGRLYEIHYKKEDIANKYYLKGCNEQIMNKEEGEEGAPFCKKIEFH